MQNRQARADTGTKRALAGDCLALAAIILTPIIAITLAVWPW